MPTKQLAASPGSPPGTLQINPEALPSRIRAIAYGPDKFHEEEDVGLDRLVELRQQWPVLWIDVVGLGDAEILRGVGERFGLHPLVLEDILHVRQRPKVEEYEDYNFIVVRMLRQLDTPDTEQLALILENDCVITFQEHEGDCLDPVRQRIRRCLGRIRTSGADYLAYAIIDAIVDNYAPHLDWYGDRIEHQEEQILATPDSVQLGALYDLKHELLSLRRILLPMRDAIGRLHREEVPLFSNDMDPYLRDCYDHSLRLLENLEVCREGAAGLMDLYMSSVSHRMNEVMKVLTVISTIFIPLSFIAGLYGMNFDYQASEFNMPELHWRWGYPAVLMIMAVIAALFLLFFARKGWLGRKSRTDFSSVRAPSSR
ncbi:MAG: magnesium/cobalt transporter CorA [Myxococcota bacterium]